MLAHVAVFPDMEPYGGMSHMHTPHAHYWRLTASVADELGLEALYHQWWYKDSDTDFIEVIVYPVVICW